MALRTGRHPERSRIHDRVLWLSLFGAAIVSPSAAVHAQGTQVTQMTCAQFATLRGTDRELFLSWLYGYYAGAAQKPAIDPSLFRQASQSMTELCEKAPGTPMIGDQMRAVFLPGQPKPADAAQATANAQPQQGSPGGPPVVSVPAGVQQFPGAGTGEGGQRIAIPQGIPDPQTTGSVRPMPEAEPATPAQRSILDMLFGRAGRAPEKPRPE